jgi:hypothetical protein
VLDNDILSLHITEIAEAFPECFSWTIDTWTECQNTYPWNPRRRLRLGRRAKRKEQSA